MRPEHAAAVAEHTTAHAKERAAMAAKGANANTLYGFDVRSAHLLRVLIQSLTKESTP